MEKINTGYLTFEAYHGKKDVGSSRIRGHWVVKNWDKVGEDIGPIELFKHGGNYDAVILQKAYFVQYAKLFKGIKILDICDPDWFDFSCPFMETLTECDAVTCSSLALSKTISNFTKKPVYFVPDRVDLSILPSAKQHKGPTKKVVWYGYSHNFSILDSTLPALVKRGLELIVISDKVYNPLAQYDIKLTNLPWSDHYLEDIQLGDVVLNPTHNKGKWRYKSDNKTSIAKALGMPVASTADELDTLMTEEQRIEASKAGLEWVKNNRDILQSVVDYKDIIAEVAKTKCVA